MTKEIAKDWGFVCGKSIPEADHEKQEWLIISADESSDHLGNL